MAARRRDLGASYRGVGYIESIREAIRIGEAFTRKLRQFVLPAVAHGTPRTCAPPVVSWRVAQRS